MRLTGTMLRASWAMSVFLAAGLGCRVSAAPPSSRTNTADSTVHSITLPHFEPELPMAPGRDEYLAVCVSCHSPRYVMMQPFFPQRQWEETVDKMVKVYGARMDQEQRSAIVQYLVATHGPDSMAVPDRGDDADFAPAPKPAARSETAPSLTPASDPAARSRQVERGAEVFQSDCAGCHGTTGRGDGFVGQILLRKPKDLATTRFSVKLLGLVLWNGKRGTAMPSWRTLPLEDLSAVAAYVQTLHQPGAADGASPNSIQRGSQVFQQNCAPCHGVAGDGKGTAATTLLPEPANFRLKQPNTDYILQVLNDGIPGTGMPAWASQISESDRRALGGYVRSLFSPDAAAQH